MVINTEKLYTFFIPFNIYDILIFFNNMEHYVEDDPKFPLYM